MKKILAFLAFIIIAFFSYFVFSYKLEIENKPNSVVLLDKNWIEIWEIIKDKKYRYRSFSLDETPGFLKKAIVELEDKRFWKNSWMDFLALMRASYHNIKAWKVVEWGSTISSQLIRNSFWLNEKRDLKHKAKEFLLALLLNTKYSKEEILEKYLNSIYFWYLNYWFESASHFYFWKSLKNLTKAEQIALIVIPKNSEKYDPYKNKSNFERRFFMLLDYFKEKWLLTKKEYELAKNEELNFELEKEKAALPYIVDFLRQKVETNGLKVEINNYLSLQGLDIAKTTIDHNLTKKINEIAQATVASLQWKNVNDFWVLIVDKKTNEIRALIWWKNYHWEDGQVNSVLATRQPGSTIKPFTYFLAFQNLWMNKYSKIIDEPVQFFTEENYAYTPKNYSLKFKWEVTLQEALSQSLNVPAVKLLNEVWAENLLNFLRDLQISSLDKNADHYWLSLTLWSWEISLYELLQAYTIFANEWNFCNFRILKWEELNCEKKWGKENIDQVVEILSDSKVKIEEFPIHWNLDFWDKKVFVKTWTSRNFRDNWTIWFTKNYLIWVWVWNKDWSEMKWVSWATWAWEIFKKIVENIETEFEIFDSSLASESLSNLEAMQPWYYEAKNSKKNIDQNRDKWLWNKYLQITSPLNWSVYKIDKNENIENQKIKLDFSSNTNFSDKKWFINWEEFRDNFWMLKKWNHKIEIITFDSWEEIARDMVFIEVLE